MQSLFPAQKWGRQIKNARTFALFARKSGLFARILRGIFGSFWNGTEGRNQRTERCDVKIGKIVGG